MSHTLTVFRGSVPGNIQPDQVTRSISPKEALIQFTHVSVCGTDEHFVRSPQALGHEGVGIVKEVGSEVDNVKIGDRVGVGFVQKVCDECQYCSSGWDQYCTRSQLYGKSNLNQGCFGPCAVWDSSCLIPIPPNLDSSFAAPLMCSGATAWTVLTRYEMRPKQRIGILGIGGLGHIAVKMAAKMGYEVVALSGTEGKKKDCLGFGAREFHVMGEESVKDMKHLDHLLICSSGDFDYTFLFSLMATQGSIYPLMVKFTPAQIPLLTMIDKGLRMQGSLVASRADISEMLQWCADNNVKPTTVIKSPRDRESVEEAMRDLEGQKVRYKHVLVSETD